MKVIRKIGKFMGNFLLAVFFLFAIVMAIFVLNRNDYGVTQFENNSILIIKDDFASPNYKKGDVVVLETKKISKYEVGEEIFVYHLDDDEGFEIELGEIASINTTGKTLSFKNGATYDLEFVAGTATKVYHKIGLYLAFILSSWGFLFTVVVPSLLIFIYQVYALIVEIRYGNKKQV